MADMMDDGMDRTHGPSTGMPGWFQQGRWWRRWWGSTHADGLADMCEEDVRG